MSDTGAETSSDIATTKELAQPRRGGQRGNVNAVKSGHYCVVGHLPKGHGWIKTLCARFKRGIEQALASQGRTVTAYESALIQSAVRWEQSCLLSQKQLRQCKPGDPMIYDHAREVARITDCRDRVLERLSLPRSEPSDSSMMPWMK